MGKKRKPTPLGKKKVVTEVKYSELEELVKRVYNAEEYNFVAVQECGNDTSHPFEVKGEVEEWESGAAAQIRAGNVPDYSNYTVLECLAEDGYIEPGNYIVEVCW